MKTTLPSLIIFSLVLLIILGFDSKIQKQNEKIPDYISVPGPIVFENEKYILKWSSHDKNYYKQEYLQKNDSLNKFNKMIFIDVLHTDMTPEQLIAVKIKEIIDRKSNDPIANYQLLDNEETGEYILDFLISNDSLYEWNIYKYKSISTNKGKAILLLGYCLHAYEDGEISLDKFFPFLKMHRVDLINKVAEYELPPITIKH